MLIEIVKNNIIIKSGIEDKNYDKASKELYPCENKTAAEVLEEQMDVKKWNSEFEDTADAFIETKMEILQAQRRKRGR